MSISIQPQPGLRNVSFRHKPYLVSRKVIIITTIRLYPFINLASLSPSFQNNLFPCSMSYQSILVFFVCVLHSSTQYVCRGDTKAAASEAAACALRARRARAARRATPGRVSAQRDAVFPLPSHVPRRDFCNIICII